MPPDSVSIKLSIESREKEAKSAYSICNARGRILQEWLSCYGVEEVSASSISLKPTSWYNQGVQEISKNKSHGFFANISYHIISRDTKRVDDLVLGLVTSGEVEHLHNVSFHTKRLKEIRETVRKDAMLNARRKADIYAEAAGSAVGEVLQIEDLDPDRWLWS